MIIFLCCPELGEKWLRNGSQSAIIPYRFNDGQLEILLICSSSKKHWVIPKGIIEPGLSPVSSASKEALEEAGVKGISDKNKLGQYSYHKL